MHTGFVGIYSFELFLPESHSLKEKRMVVRSVKANLQNRVGCSIAEVDHHDVWQRARLTLSCAARAAGEAERLLDEAGPERVLFGSDAATDGPDHYVRRPPNIEMTENYNIGLLRLARRLRPEVTRKLLEDNARTLFGIPRP